MSEPRLFGWTWDQWAIASARMGNYEPTHKGACELRKAWMLTYSADPGEIAIVGVPLPRNHSWAEALFSINR